MSFSDDDFILLALEQLTQIRSTDRSVDDFVAKHLDSKETMGWLVLTASEKMTLTLKDDKVHSGSMYIEDTDDVLHVLHVSTIPVASRHAGWWFAKEYGGYIDYINQWYKRRGQDFEEFNVLVHFIFGFDRLAPKGLWATHSLVSFMKPHIRWIFPKDCISEKDRIKILQLRSRYNIG